MGGGQQKAKKEKKKTLNLEGKRVTNHHWEVNNLHEVAPLLIWNEEGELLKKGVLG